MASWNERLGPWLAVGTSPAALLLGAELARRHDGVLPALMIPVGVASMAAVLWPQALFGLRGPRQDGATLNEVSHAYLTPAGDRLLIVLITASMVGWLALNVAVGGAATGAWSGLPEPLAIGIQGLLVLLLGSAGIARWNRVAVLAAGLSALLAVVAAWGGGAGLRIGGTATAAFADVPLFIGYVAAFSVRSPDFTAGLPNRRHLVPLVVALVGSTLLVATAGALAYGAQGGGDVVEGLLRRGGTAAVVLLTLSTLAPALAAQHSGGLGLARVAGARLAWVAVPATGLVGTLLAIARFDRAFGDWLELLALAAPPVIVPLAVERLRRHRGGLPRLVPLWTWLPGAGVGVALAFQSDGLALSAGALITVLMTAAWLLATRSGDPTAGT